MTEPSASDMGRAVIVCHDCDVVITTVREHFIKNSYIHVLFTPMNKQFKDHIDHDLSITIPLKENEE